MKTPSQRLRATIYRLWERRENDLTPEMYYKKVMAVLRGQVLKEIREDKKFMEDQLLLSSNYE